MQIGSPAEFILSDPVGAHLYYFPHRHPQRSPVFHERLILDFHNPQIARLVALIFRGGAKSTLLEETLTLLAITGIIRFGIVIGDSETRAVDRLSAIKYELLTNERLIEDFGYQRGEEWSTTRITLKSGTCLQAFGRNQSIRGIKHLDSRPDFAFLDDIESRESVDTPEAIAKTMRWLTSDVMPAMADKYMLRVAATPLHPSAACVQLSADASYTTRRCPVYYFQDVSELDSDTPSHTLVSAWPERFPLTKMLELKEEYERLGMLNEFAQEYLCEAEVEATKAFNVTTFPIDTTLRHTFQPTYIVCDPARTAKKSSSLSGFIVCSIAGSRITIWEAEGLTIRPDAIIEKLFQLSAQYDPIHVGVEKDGLEEFILQPIRARMLSSRTSIPLLPLKAPKDKIGFIKSLQPFISAGDVVLARPCPLLEAQLKNFPAGKIDILNALAYVPLMSPGTPVYTDFDYTLNLIANPIDMLPRSQSWPIMFALNSTKTETAGIALTLIDRKLTVLADNVSDGPPSSSAEAALAHLRLITSRNGNVVVPRHHFQNPDTIGLRAALYALGERPSQGGDPAQARAAVQSRISSRTLVVSGTARWTLRALTSGYAYPRRKPNEPPPNTPTANSYRTLTEALESAIQLMFASFEDRSAQTQIDERSGRVYLSSRPRR
jgi:hypothetical protein